MGYVKIGDFDQVDDLFSFSQKRNMKINYFKFMFDKIKNKINE